MLSLYLTRSGTSSQCSSVETQTMSSVKILKQKDAVIYRKVMVDPFKSGGI